MADQYDILGFDMYDISGPQAWRRHHGLTSDDKVSGAMVDGYALNEPRPIGISGPLGAWDRSRGIDRHDILGGPHHGHHGGRRNYGYSVPTYYYPADTYEIIDDPIDGIWEGSRGIRFRNRRKLTSDEVLHGFLRGRDCISGPRAAAIEASIIRGNDTLSTVGGVTEVKSYGVGKRWWASNKRGFLVHQADDNLVLYGITGPGTMKALWNGWHPVFPPKGQVLTLQDDGNLVITQAGKIIWTSRTNGWTTPPKTGFLHDIGSAVHTITHAAASVYNEVDKLASKIPILGTPLHAALQLTAGSALHTVDAVANGDNVSKVALSALKDNLTNAATIGQYASVITSAIPGIGTVGAGLNAALGAASAISQGKPVTDALISAVKNAAVQAIPGGAIAQKVASEAFEVGKSLAHGERLDHIALDRARAQVPAAYRGVFDAGLAVAQGKKLQEVLVKGAQSLPIGQLAREGEKLMSYSEPLRRAALALSGEPRKGFQTATALLARTGVPITAVVALRNKLPAAQRGGFDKSVAEHALCYTVYRRV